MRVGVTGSSGLLGSAFMESMGRGAVPLDRTQVDLAAPISATELLREAEIDVLIHCAANTDVEECERNPVAALRDNTILTEVLAGAASPLGIKVIYFSSTGVYGATKDTPYSELDPAKPTTAHHRSKFLGEQAVLRNSPFNLVLRTGWLFGGPVDSRKNFVASRLREAVACDGTMFSDTTQFGVPTATTDVVERTVRLLGDGAAGLFNMVSQGSASRFSYVSEIVRLADIPVELKPAGAFERVAPVSPNEMAVNLRMEALGYESMPSWQSSLKSYVSSIVEQISG